MKKKALAVWGGWEGHKPRETMEVFLPRLAAEGYEVELSHTLDAYLDGKGMAAYQLILQSWTGGTLTPEQEEGLLDTVSKGAGFAGWHGGIIDAFHDNVNYHWMTGGQWVAHPGDILPSYTVDVVDQEHPITRGMKAFELKETEQYYLHTDPSNHILCTTTFTGKPGGLGKVRPGTVMPYAWTRDWGKGRVFVAGWGHTQKDFDLPEAREIVVRGILWAGR